MSIRINGVDKESTIKVMKNDNPLGSYHLMDKPELYEPQRTNHFEFIINGSGFTPADGRLERAGMDGSESDTVKYFPQPQEMIRMAVVSAPVPHFSQESIDVKRGNTMVHYAGNITWEQGSLVVNDYIGADTKSILYAWQALSGNPYTEKVGHASDYKKDCILVEYTPDFQKVRQWKLYGCWVKSLSEEAYSNESSGKKTITATIVYDRGVMDVDDLV